MPLDNKLNKKEYDQIKEMLNKAGNKRGSIALIAKLMDRSGATVGQINKTKDYESYVDYNQKRLGSGKYRKASPEKKGNGKRKDAVASKEILNELREIKKVGVEIHTLLNSAKRGGFRLW